MDIKSIVEGELRRTARTFKWLVTEMKVSNDGLKSGLENESIKLRDFRRLIEILNIPVERFFEKKYLISNTQAMVKEPESSYKKEVELLRENNETLKQSLKDKQLIIDLLTKNQTHR